jgi:hypothetical protein
MSEALAPGGGPAVRTAEKARACVVCAQRSACQRAQVALVGQQRSSAAGGFSAARCQRTARGAFRARAVLCRVAQNAVAAPRQAAQRSARAPRAGAVQVAAPSQRGAASRRHTQRVAHSCHARARAGGVAETARKTVHGSGAHAALTRVRRRTPPAPGRPSARRRARARAAAVRLGSGRAARALCQGAADGRPLACSHVSAPQPPHTHAYTHRRATRGVFVVLPSCMHCTLACTPTGHRAPGCARRAPAPKTPKHAHARAHASKRHTHTPSMRWPPSSWPAAPPRWTA